MKLSWVHSTSRSVEPSRLESPRATWAKPSSRHHQVEKTCLVVPSGFIKCVLDVSSAWVPLSVTVLCSPAGVNLRTVWRRQLLHITTPCRQPDLVASFTVVNRLTFGGSSLTLFKGVGPRMGSPESFLRGLGYPGSSLPSCPSLSLDNLLYGEDFPWSAHRVGVTWVQAGFTGLSPDV